MLVACELARDEEAAFGVERRRDERVEARACAVVEADQAA